MMEYYENSLNEIEKNFYHKMVNALRKRELFVKADGIADHDSFLKCFSAVKYDFPELFYVDFRNYTYIPYEDGWEYQPNYLYEKDETTKNRSKLMNSFKKLSLNYRKGDLRAYIKSVLIFILTWFVIVHMIMLH